MRPLAPRPCPRCKIPQAWDAFAADGKNSTCRTCCAEYDRQRNTPEKNRASWLWRYYRLTPEQYDAILEQQGGVCGVCKEPPSEDSLFHVDHDHTCCAGRRTCGKCIRGLLCARCNLGISLMERFPEEVIAWLAIRTVRSRP